MQSNTTKRLVLTALMASLVLAGTFLFRIPAGNGYLHLGDGMIFLAVLLLGGRYGALAAALGSVLADVLGSYAIWAPWTLIIKGGMALLMALVLATLLKLSSRKQKENAATTVIYLISMAVAVVWMVIGYYVATGVIYGNWITPLMEIPGNIGQGVAGILLTFLIAAPLAKTPARRYFTYLMSKKFK